MPWLWTEQVEFLPLPAQRLKNHVCLLAAVFITSRLEKKSVKAPTERRHKTPAPLLRLSGRSPWLMPADGEAADGPSQWYSVRRDTLLAWHRKQLCRNKCGDPSGWSSSCSHTRSGGRTGSSLVIKKTSWESSTAPSPLQSGFQPRNYQGKNFQEY